MASDFQRRKVSVVMAAMDTDHDDHLTESDFEALAARWAALCPDDPAAADRLRAIMLGWWAQLRATADRDGDHRVSLDEVLRVVDALPTMPDAVTTTATAMFDAADTNADGRVDATELDRMLRAWTGRPTTTDLAALDTDSDGHLTRAEFTHHWTEFWAGDDPSAAGSYLFGPLPDA